MMFNAKDVLLALGEKLTSESPNGLLKQLEELNTEPEMNYSLRDAMKNPEIHQHICARDVNAVKESIEDFLVKLLDKNNE